MLWVFDGRLDYLPMKEVGGLPYRATRNTSNEESEVSACIKYTLRQLALPQGTKKISNGSWNEDKQIENIGSIWIKKRAARSMVTTRNRLRKRYCYTEALPMPNCTAITTTSDIFPMRKQPRLYNRLWRNCESCSKPELCRCRNGGG